MKRAIVYHAYCQPEYVRMATISAESAKWYMPDIETVLLTELPVAKGFDRVIQVEPVPLALVNFAPLLELPTEYDSAIYFDCDSYICAALYDVFDLVEDDRVDMALATTRHRDKGSNAYMYPGAKDVPEAYPDYRGTPIAYQNSAKVREFFTSWSRLFHEHERRYRAGSPWADKRFQRQPAMRVALYYSDLTIVTLPPKYYVVSSLIIHGKVRAFDTEKCGRRRVLAKRAKAMNRHPNELRLVHGGREHLLKDMLFNE